MRPVNLIPPEQRRGDRAPLRSGPLAYIIVGALAIVLLAVTGLVMTQNSIAEHEADIARLEAERDATAQKAQALAPYTEFVTMQQTREETIRGLAQSRFDWERVLRELALVVPQGISLSELTGAAAADANDPLADPATTSTGPVLTLIGCAGNQTVVADLIASLEDIDGVTRVKLLTSQRAASGDGESQSGEGSCASSPNLANFEVEAQFQPVAAAPLEAAPSPSVTAPVLETNSQGEQLEQAEGALNVVPGVGR